ncbi:MAG: sortase [Lachnospiraceae bacterium]|nr:sortase [Lachnospiraceae bacterium]
MEDSKFEKVICWIVIAVFLCSFIGLIGYLVWDANQDKIEEDIQKIHDEAAELVALPSVIEERPEERTEIVYQPTDAPKPTGVPSPTPVPTLEPTESPTPEPTREPEQKSGGTVNSGTISLEQLYAINPDIAGWIRIPGTEVDYPFAAVGNKKSIYEDTAYDGKTKSAFGTIFTHNNVSDPTSIPNLVLYGHNMAATGYGMFTQLLKYKNKDFAKNHARIELVIGDTPLVYEFFCCYNVSTTDSFLYEQTAFTGPKDLTSYSEEILRRSKVKAEGATAGAAHYLTLSTCDRGYDRKNGRFVVVFVRK